ncbi:maleylpyruvate isomerase family mycothiol-dependent enzyme [Kribbella sp. NBC_01505]|uniref:maleylpyruvate isomerase family mycothiol-dependent enzyme n=1 Tax=Kribbella sp. NBC_01505 TaxID=2903580 RepID=UPI00386F5199
MTEIRELVAAERTDLVEVLSGLTAEEWDQPSLCTGWRVREVVAHITMAYRYSMPRVLFGIAKSGGFNRFSERAARADTAALSNAELLSCLRDNIHHPWQPPGGGYEGALSHDVIHGLDMTVALGIDRRVPLDRLRVVLDGLGPKHLKYFGVDLSGIELRATDLDWSYGAGEVVTGTAQDFVGLVSGRESSVRRGS